VISLWPFQAEALAALEAAWPATRRLLVAWATGLGKTVLFAHVLARRPGRALVLAHRDELIAQAVAKLRLVMPAAAIGVVQAERDERDAPLVVASVAEAAELLSTRWNYRPWDELPSAVHFDT
jgi:ATP-dependent helicase IRC3